MKLWDATIQTTGTWKPLQGRKGDVALMEVFANKKSTAKEMKDINRCRMFSISLTSSSSLDII
jgi:hypothetical protein